LPPFIVSSPNFSSTFNNALCGAVALSPSEACAVGQALDEWNGTSWTGEPAPSNGTLQRVAALSDTDLRTVGATDFENGTRTSRIEHFDGTSWGVVPSP
jgi:hypothetical protein